MGLPTNEQIMILDMAVGGGAPHLSASMSQIDSSVSYNNEDLVTSQETYQVHDQSFGHGYGLYQTCNGGPSPGIKMTEELLSRY